MANTGKEAHGTNARIEHVLDKLRGDIPHIEERMALMLEAAIVRRLSMPGRGKLRRQFTKSVKSRGIRSTRLTRGPGQRASAPGDSPAVDSGNLRGSIIHGRTANGIMRVGTNVKYAPALEFGTHKAGASKRVVIAPRPFMRPAWRDVEKQTTDDVIAKLRVNAQQLGR